MSLRAPLALCLASLACTPSAASVDAANDAPQSPVDASGSDLGARDVTAADLGAADAPRAPEDVPPTPTGCPEATGTRSASSNEYVEGPWRTTVAVSRANGCARSFEFRTNAPLRDMQPSNPRAVREDPARPQLLTRNTLLDGLYALAIDEVRENSVASIREGGFDRGAPIDCPAGGCFQTGRLWTYVWTRDTSYSVDLGLASLDPLRARNSMEFKLSERRAGGGVEVVQDTGTGGSWPVSTDRVVWSLGARALLAQLDGDARTAFRDRAFDALVNTLAHDRAVVFDPRDGLYSGEQSFLDWREQTYPAWTAQDSAHIAMSRALSTNALHYAALTLAADLATERGDAARATALRAQADALKTSIRTRFHADGSPGWSAFSTTFLDPSPVRRYDLLASALTVLTGISSPEESRALVAAYPEGPFGPAVIWPQQQDTAIYHNRSIWPFVTAYWLRAARAVRNDAVALRAYNSLLRGAALNLSNMENLEFATGAPHVEEGATSGPVVNSQRQLWSVAATVSMIHDALFGIAFAADGMRVGPYVPREFRNTWLSNADSVALAGLTWRGHRFTVRVNLPPSSTARTGAYALGSVRLNGSPVTGAIRAEMLPADAVIEATMVERDEPAGAITEVGALSDFRNVFGPRTPVISSITQEPSGALTLGLAPDRDAPGDLTYTVFRDGVAVARALPGTTVRWTDPTSTDSRAVTHCYALEATFTGSQNASQHSLPQCYWGLHGERVRTVTAYDLRNVGGAPASDHGRFHYENWGDPGSALVLERFRPEFTGDFLIQPVAANGAGGFTTGITCGVKLLTVEDADSGAEVARGYAVMPQTGDWDTWRDGSFVRARLDAAHAYRVTLRDDDSAVNMSAFRHFTRYTGGTGGAGGAFTRVNVSALKILALSGTPTRSGVRVAIDGAHDADDFAEENRTTVGIPTMTSGRVGLDWDDDYLYVAVATRAFDAPFRAYNLYLQSGGGPLGVARAVAGLSYSDQVPGVPFEATHVISLRAQADASDGSGPWSGVFVRGPGGWTRALRFEQGRDYFVSATGERAISLRIARSQLGAPSRLRVAGHTVTGAGNYNDVVPSTHQPWMTSRTEGFWEIDLTSAHPMAGWSVR